MGVPSNIPGFHWLLDRQQTDSALVLRLMTPELKSAATVYVQPVSGGQHIWHVWDRHGGGGENDAEKSIEHAMYEAEQATARWGKHRVCRRLLACDCPACIERYGPIYLGNVGKDLRSNPTGEIPSPRKA